MIFKFLNKEKPDINVESINIACLLIHAAKIDENYTSEEREIIKKTVNKLYPNLDSLDDVISKAEQKENDSNHIQEFTRDVKSLSKENKIKDTKEISGKLVFINVCMIIKWVNVSNMQKNTSIETGSFIW